MPPHENAIRQRRQYSSGKSDIAGKTDNKDGLEGFDHQTETLQLSPSNDAAQLFTNPETAEHRSSTLRNNPMSGMTFPRLCRLLMCDKFSSVDWWRYKARIACLFGVSLFNSCLAVLEWLYIKCCLRNVFVHAQQDSQPPLFVLGHPRTGTTLLHSLLAQDTDQFATCSTFCAGFPDAFLSFESLGKTLFANMLSETRPMDNMKLHFDLPQEDELATCLLTGGRYSPYMSLYFIRQEAEYRQYQTFREAPLDEVACWTRAFEWLCLKLKVRSILEQQQQQSGITNDMPSPKRILLKSPCHTGRIRHLLKLYPNAQFVYVHRHPLDVFLSSVHMANTTYGYMFLQRPHPDDLKEYILKQGEILVEEYVSCVDELEELQLGKNLVQVSFDDLTSNPFETIREIYNGLKGLQHVFSDDSNDDFPNTLKEYCEDNLKGYRKNQFDARFVDADLLNEIQTRWNVQYERFGY